MTIRPALPDDVPAVLHLIRQLADYEREPDAVRTTEADLHRALFPDEGHPTTWCHLAEADGGIVGMALWFTTFSTWEGRNGVWLEDLFVLPEHRGAGHGKALLASLAQVCVARGYARLEWTVLDWNTPSIEFYKSLGAVAMDEWTTHRVTGTALQELAHGES